MLRKTTLSNQSDFDECSMDPRPCDENAGCTNADGSYSCTCKQGYTGDGAVCEGTVFMKLSHLPHYTSCDNI